MSDQFDWTTLKPMLARLGPLRDKSKYAFEIKWDGVRALAFIERSKMRLVSRNSIDITRRYPELAGLPENLNAKSAILDGEIVALDERGVPRFHLLQNRMHLASEAESRRRAAAAPVTFIIFDILQLDGRSLMQKPYSERRKILSKLRLEGPHWSAPEPLKGDFDDLFESVKKMQLEGLIAKRLDSPYVPAYRGDAWIKIKVKQRQELILCGYEEGQGNRAGLPGAVLLGYYDRVQEPRTPVSGFAKRRNSIPPRLVFAGECGTGFNTKTLHELKALLDERRIDNNPFQVNPPRGRGMHFARPELVGEFEFTEWTQDGSLRHPVYAGLREDKSAHEVIREEA